ncbi:VMAP-C domain-containing protein [Streptomyces sp. SP18CS02]|uniref:VMAP-C domain-containing protein n=1 Tax=Streptomyces sp. SP18CS02 TaxID=3002531 RepID=UPI002E75C987|nr:trypsin-like peptidase domain-containing protein [Streptomyces sp. SP18CS02]MEE1757256.1 trypsin-like peptidase domain-containing protein [Streptomyces sp. SP18CS02]
MADAHTDLDALVRAATVRFLPARPDATAMWGSGFLVAPGWVLTAAHVLLPYLADDRKRTFRVAGSPTHHGIGPVEARLEAWLVKDVHAGSVPPQQDVALVRLLDETVDHECVWIGDQAVPPVGERRHVYGFRPEPDDSHPYELWTSDIVGNVRDGRCSIRFTPTADFPPGVSGGPVLDPVSGAVVALTKSGRVDKDGGRAVPLLALRAFGPLYREVLAEHDRWHAERADSTPGSWLTLQERLPGQARAGGDVWSPADRVTALRQLAQLTDPPPKGAVEALVEHVTNVRQELAYPPLASWRDGHGLLYDGGSPLPAIVFLHYLRLVSLLVERSGGGDAGTSAAEELERWTAKRVHRVSPYQMGLVTGARLPASVLAGTADGTGADSAGPGASGLAGGPGRSSASDRGGATLAGAAAEDRVVIPYPGPGDGVHIVVVEIEPLPYRTVHWQIRIDDGSGDDEIFDSEKDPDGVEPAKLLQRLRGPLDEAFQIADAANSHPAACEVVLPADAFDTPVHRWQLAEMARLGDEAHLPLGARRRVVLRDLSRRGRPDDEWAGRWDAVMAADRLSAVRTPPVQQAPRRQHLKDMAAGAVPVLCRPAGRGPGRKAMELALEAGHGIALWHIEGHPGSVACGGDCDAFHQAAAELLTEAASAGELPDLLRRIREGIHERRDRGHWAEAVAVLYDDPGRPVPAGPMGLWSSPA